MEDPILVHGTRNIIFGKYEMGRLLGQGTFAKVYYGKDIKTSESVAIKVINKDHVRKEGLMDQIIREISVMRLVRHPNIVELKEVMATKQKIFVVMEYVKGGELFAKVAAGKIKEDVARKYFQQLISAVDYCHSRGVFHRDLKPENLLLDENENLKVSDFGLSALSEQLRNDGLLHTQCGTPAYVAPEVLRRKGYDGAKSDIWSCGVILYVLLAGCLPFQHENMMKMYRKVFKAEYEFPPWFSPEAKKLVSKLLVADPEKRITIAAIARVPWFQKSFSRSNSFSNEEEDEQKEKSKEIDLGSRSKPSPPFYNAFEFISAMSSGFDLSSLFESKKKSAGSLFTSKCSASTIMSRLESLAKKVNFKVVFSKEYKVKIQGTREGRKGKLSVTAEVFEVAPQVAVVEFTKSAGDTLEYRKFCEEDIRPALKDIVWSWQGRIKFRINGETTEFSITFVLHQHENDPDEELDVIDVCVGEYGYDLMYEDHLALALEELGTNDPILEAPCAVTDGLIETVHALNALPFHNPSKLSSDLENQETPPARPSIEEPPQL